jgi:hypothetical protein
MATAATDTKLFGQEMQLLGSAFRKWLELQDESIRLCAEAFNSMASPSRWQKRAEAMLNPMVAAAEESSKAMAQSMNQGTKTGLELFQQVISLRPAETADKPERVTGLWDTMLDTVQANTNAILEANRHMMESWTSMTREMSQQQAEQAKHAAEQAA